MATKPAIADWWPLPLRLVVGYGFIAHGYAKLVRGPDAFIAILAALGVPLPHLLGWLTIGCELVCGLAVLLGAFVTLMSVPMATILVVAMLSVHLQNGFSSIKLLAVTANGPQFGPPGVETDLLYLACLAALVAGGSGPWALDTLVRRSRGAR
jgi:putative oxidoreductase